jgi:hypothetical protein
LYFVSVVREEKIGEGEKKKKKFRLQMNQTSSSKDYSEKLGSSTLPTIS